MGNQRPIVNPRKLSYSISELFVSASFRDVNDHRKQASELVEHGVHWPAP